MVRRSFRQQFCPRKPRGVPRPNAFHRLIERFEREGATWPSVPSGRSSTADEEVEKVKVFFKENSAAHVRQASQQLKMATGKVWKILRRNLRWRPYRPHLAPALTSAHQASRLQACRFWLQHAEDWFERVLWSDEKWFVLMPAANTKNKVIWCPSNPHKIILCKKAHGEKVMGTDGVGWHSRWQVPPSALVPGSSERPVVPGDASNGHVASCEEHGNQEALLVSVGRRSLHVSAVVMDFLRSKFNDRIISRGSTHHWSAHSPDLSCLDFSFWSQAIDQVVETEPQTIAELKKVVEDFAAGITA